MDTNKERVRALLHNAHVQIDATLSRMDTMDPHELAEMAGLAEGAKGAFVRQGVCGSLTAGEHPSTGLAMPEFNTNSGCGPTSGGLDVERGLVLVRALRAALR